MRFLATLALLLVPAVPSASVEPVETSRPAPRAALTDALEVLHAWDARRARAWAEADPDALGALYVRGSEAGRADVRLLRSYEQRGVVVRRLVTQVFAVRVQGRDATTLRLSVFDRVAGGEMVHAGQTTELRSSRPVTRTITFRHVSGSWRVSGVCGVSGSGRGPRAARP
jgi:hypothetical protein